MAALILLLALLAATGVRGANDSPVALDGWREARSSHLTVVTNLGESTVLGLLQVLEAQRLIVLERMGTGAEDSLPTTIFIFADEASYAPFRLAEREGQFLPTAFENLLVVHGGAAQRPLGLAASHEYTHALVSESGRPMPLWLHEGLAEYFSTIRLFADRVVLGAAVPGHRAALRHRAFLPFVDLAEVGGRSPLYHGESGRRFYAQSWLMVHYLLSDEVRAAGLFAEMGGLAEGEDAAAELFGLSAEALDGALRRYLNLPVLPSRTVELVRPAPGPGTPGGSRALETSETAYRLGLVALEQARWSESAERYALARDLLETAVTLAPDGGDAHAGLAHLEAALGHGEVAQQLFERAVYLDALEPRSYVHYAQLLLRDDRLEDSRELGSMMPDPQWAAVRATQMLRRALELEPRHPRLREAAEVEKESGAERVPAAPGGVSNRQRPPQLLW